MGLGFSRARRLRKRRDFLLVQNDGARVGSSQFILLMRARLDELPSRVGITVTRKYGNAVHRNRIKRLLREVLRLYPDLVPKGIDMVVIVKAGKPLDVGLAVVSRDLLQVSGRIRQQAIRLRSDLAKSQNRSHTGGSTESSSS